MPLLRKRTVIAAKLEGTEGVAEAIAAADAKFLASDVVYKPEPTVVERNVSNRSFARNASIVAIKLVRITFKTEILGSGTATVEPAWGNFLKASGFKVTLNAGTSQQYDPVTTASYGPDTGNSSITIWVYEDGKVKKARGCRGTGRIVGEASNIAQFEWDFLGIYDGEVDASLPSLASGYDANTPPLVESASINLQGIGADKIFVKNFTIDLGNTITPRFSANDIRGIKNLFISDRVVTGTIDPEEALVANFNSKGALARLMDGDTGAFTITVGSAAGNKVVIDAPAATAQITSQDEGDRDGILTSDIGLGFFVPLNEHADNKEIRITTL